MLNFLIKMKSKINKTKKIKEYNKFLRFLSDKEKYFSYQADQAYKFGNKKKGEWLDAKAIAVKELIVSFTNCYKPYI